MLYDNFARIYPPEYMVGFYVTDEEAVNAYLTYLAIEQLELDGVVVDEVEQGTVVYARVGQRLYEINWAEPEKRPKDLPGYADLTYQFLGPHDVQQRRAQLLADVAAVEDKDVLSLSEVEEHFVVYQFIGAGMCVLVMPGASSGSNVVPYEDA